jgi:branched-chain amino acid transport system substrate-binding protein
MKMKKLFALLLVLTMTMSLLAGCGEEATNGDATTNEDTATNEDTSTSSDATDAPIKLGMLTPTSGDLAMYGQAVLNAAQLAIEEINAAGGVNGRQLELKYYDNEGDATKSINLFNRLADQDNIDALVGPVISGTSLVVAPEADRRGIPMVTPTATNAEVTVGMEYVYRVCFTDPYQGAMGAKFASENLGAQTAIIFTNVSSDYSIGLAESFTEAFPGEVLANESYTNEDNDFKAIISKIASLGADIIYIPDYYNIAGLIAKQLKEAGVEATLVGVDGWDGIQVDYAADAEGGFFTNHYSTSDEAEVVQTFVTTYEEEYGEVPNALAALGYDAVKVVAAAMERAGSTDKDAVRDEIRNTDQDAVTGHIKFDENGDISKEVSIITVKDGQLLLETKVSN